MSKDFILRVILFIISIIISLNVVLAQKNSSEDEIVYMKCGTPLGIRKNLINGCSMSLDFSNEENNNICNCLISLYSKHFTYKEFDNLMSKYGGEMLQKIIESNNKSVVEGISLCMSSFIDRKSEIEITDRFVEGFVAGCIFRFKDTPNLNHNKYCSCVLEEIKTKYKKITYEIMGEFEDVNSELHNEVNLKCLNSSSNFRKSSSEDVFGTNNEEKINLIAYNDLFKLKINIGGINKYYIFDTGASDILISKEFEEELIKKNILTKNNYVGVEYYLLADESLIKCRVYQIDNVIIGNFKVNNVIIAISEKADISFLVGKSLLDKFNSWSIENKSSVLILRK